MRVEDIPPVNSVPGRSPLARRVLARHGVAAGATDADRKDGAFRDWFGDSKVVDEHGQPLPLYHATPADFSVFKTNSEDIDLGAHFGTIEQALVRGADSEGVSVLPVYLRLTHPLRLRDEGDFSPYTIAAQLRQHGIHTRAATNAGVQRAIIAAGYDGIVYLNRREIPGLSDPYGEATEGWSDAEVRERWPGARDSYIAFRPEQIKSLFNVGTYSLENPDIRFARDAEGQLPVADVRGGDHATQAAAFDAWFQGSKVVDDYGQPLTMYHGTFNDFDVFDTKDGTTEGAAFFSTSPAVANVFADPIAWGQDPEDVDIRPNVVPVFLAIQNPLRVTREAVTQDGSHSFDAMRRMVAVARQAGHDGLHIVGYGEGGIVADQWAAFHPYQIKSVFNCGSFDADNEDIRFARVATRSLPREAKGAPPVPRASDDSCEP